MRRPIAPHSQMLCVLMTSGSRFMTPAPFDQTRPLPGWASAMFVAMLSLGEAIWSPRWYGEPGFAVPV